MELREVLDELKRYFVMRLDQEAMLECALVSEHRVVRSPTENRFGNSPGATTRTRSKYFLHLHVSYQLQSRSGTAH